MSEATLQEAQPETVHLTAAPEPFVRPVEVLKAIFSPFHALVDTLLVSLGEGRLALRAVDRTDTALLTVEGPGPQGAALRFGLDLDHVKDALSCCKGPVILEVAEGVLAVRNQGVRRTLALLDDKVLPDPRIPAVELRNAVQVERDALALALKHAGKVSDHIALVVAEDFELHADGERDQVRRTFRRDGAILTKAEPSRTLLSIDYLDRIVRAIPRTCILRLELRTNYPLRMAWSHQGYDFLFLLAPRVEDEEESAPASSPTSPTPEPARADTASQTRPETSGVHAEADRPEADEPAEAV